MVENQFHLSSFILSKQCFNNFQFDESFYPAYFEDLDFMRRLRLSNKQVMHFHRHGWKYLVFTYLIFSVINLNLFYIALLVYVYSYIGFGMLNYIGHSQVGPINSMLINLFAPFEGNHKDHHEKSKKKISS